MNLLSKILGSGQNSGLKLRFNKTSEEWQVFKGMKILYIGEKAQCEKYVENFQVTL